MRPATPPHPWRQPDKEVTGIDIPQRDVSQFMTITGAVGYLVDHRA
jgi:hypothetical protein